MRIVVFSKNSSYRHDEVFFMPYTEEVINYESINISDDYFCNFLKSLNQDGKITYSIDNILTSLKENFNISLNDLLILHIDNRYESFRQILSIFNSGTIPFNFIMFSRRSEIDSHGILASDISNNLSIEDIFGHCINKISDWEIDYETYNNTPYIQEYVSSIISFLKTIYD